MHDDPRMAYYVCLHPLAYHYLLTLLIPFSPPCRPSLSARCAEPRWSPRWTPVSLTCNCLGEHNFPKAGVPHIPRLRNMTGIMRRDHKHVDEPLGACLACSHQGRGRELGQRIGGLAVKIRPHGYMVSNARLAFHHPLCLVQSAHNFGSMHQR